MTLQRTNESFVKLYEVLDTILTAVEDKLEVGSRNEIGAERKQKFFGDDRRQKFFGAST